MIDIRGLSVNVGAFSLNDISLNIKGGEYFVILGPTGAGKTILLESIAGLYPLRNGEILVNNKDISNLEPENRRISIVYQDHALFPHLSVWDNIAFGLRMRKEKAPRIETEIQRVAELFQIEHLLKRKPDTLSGGERQRVALARAVITRPEVLLLDEPLGALDPETRENIQDELLKLHNELAVTTLHVTHDFEEAIVMGRRMAVIGGGSIKQTGTSDEIFRHPNSEFVARFIMAKNILSGISEKGADGNTVFKTGTVKFLTTSELEGECQASIRPEDIIITRNPAYEDEINRFPVTVTKTMNKGSILNVTVSIPPELTCLLTHHTFNELELGIGQQVFVNISPSSVHLFTG